MNCRDVTFNAQTFAMTLDSTENVLFDGPKSFTNYTTVNTTVRLLNTTHHYSRAFQSNDTSDFNIEDGSSLRIFGTYGLLRNGSMVENSTYIQNNNYKATIELIALSDFTVIASFFSIALSMLVALM